MNSTQLLILGIGGLTILLAAMLVHSAAVQRHRGAIEVDPAFRQVGTFGSLRNFGTDAMLPPTRYTTVGLYHYPLRSCSDRLRGGGQALLG